MQDGITVGAGSAGCVPADAARRVRLAEAGGIRPFRPGAPAHRRPNLQFHFIPAYPFDLGRRLSRGYGLTLHVCDLLPGSLGRLSLESPDPLGRVRGVGGLRRADASVRPQISAGNPMPHPDDRREYRAEDAGALSGGIPTAL